MCIDVWWLLCDMLFVQIWYQWVLYDQILCNLKWVLIVFEDLIFVINNGYDVDVILQVWEKNKVCGRIVVGGLMIMQQFVCNLFLLCEKSYICKGQELIIMWMFEMVFDKECIFEIYLNLVEWGCGVYGVEVVVCYYYKIFVSWFGVWQFVCFVVMLLKLCWFDVYCGLVYQVQCVVVIVCWMGVVELL